MYIYLCIFIFVCIYTTIMTIKSALEACHNDVSDGCMLRPIEAEAEAEADADSAANMYAHLHDA